MFNGRVSSTGKQPVTALSKTLFLVLLVESVFGFGQQPPASPLDSLLTGAQQAQAAGDYTRAATDYRQAAQLSPATPELWADLGLMQQETGDFAGAMLSFRRANRLNPSLYVPNLFLGIDYAHEGNAAVAVPFLIKGEKLNNKDPQAPLALGRAYIALQNFSAASRALDRATRLDPKLGAAWFTLGIARLDEVEVDARTMSEQGKESPFASALYADSLAKQGRFIESASLYKTLLDSHAQPPCLRSQLGFALLRNHDPAGAAAAFAADQAAHPECGLALLGQARIHIDNGDAESALKVLQELWNRDHGFFTANAPVLLEGLSTEKAALFTDLISAQQRDDFGNALLGIFDPAAQHPYATAPAPSPVRDRTGDSRTAQQDYAAGKFEQCALRLQAAPAPLTSTNLRLLVACSYFIGDYQRASNAADALRAKDPNSFEDLYWSIRANEQLAFASLAQFQQLEPNSARNHILLGDIYNQLERYEDAQAEYRKALAIAPDDPAALLGLASAYLNDNNNQAGIATARTALIRRPEDPELNLIMGEGLISQHQFADAEPYLTKSLHAKPQMLPHIHALIGKAYAETGRTQEAIEQLKLGASSDDDGSVHYLLSRLYRQLGDTKDANEALNRMKAIKQQRADRGFKRVEDLDLSSLEPASNQPSAP